ncbi:FxsA family protein [Alkanindiges sp. WGS2144]|uniref:FxsA family protein n=1 Tax=Alkanindiges sp. WGS2144 TaxID=3366808 RepID=UPI0037503501
MIKPLLLLLVGIVIEVIVWVTLAQFMSGWWIVLWTIGTFILGLKVLRGSASSIMPQLQQMQVTGQMSAEPKVQTNLARALAGFLLLLPGVLSDILALLMLIPAVQTALRGALLKTMLKRQQAMMQNVMSGMGMGGQSDMMNDLMRRMNEMNGQADTGNNRRPTVIDGEARTVEPEVKRIKPAND